MRYFSHFFVPHVSAYGICDRRFGISNISSVLRSVESAWQSYSLGLKQVITECCRAGAAQAWRVECFSCIGVLIRASVKCEYYTINLLKHGPLE